jgi:GntR family transcriptional regulator
VRELDVEEELAGRIAAGSLQAGDRLPAERELAREFGVGRVTIREALGSLIRRGLVIRSDNGDAFVSRPKVEHDLRGAVTGFTEQMEQLGLEPRAKVLTSMVLVPPTRVCEALGMERGDRALKIERVRYASRLALTLEETWLPDALFPELAGLSLTGSIYTLMRDCYARGPVRAVERLEAVAASAPEGKLLHIPIGAPLMLVERTSYDANDVPVEYARDRHRGDRARFLVESVTHLPVT